MQREDTELGPVSQVIQTLDGELLTPDGRLLQQSEANLCHSSPDRVSVCSCTCYPRYVSTAETGNIFTVKGKMY